MAADGIEQLTALSTREPEERFIEPIPDLGPTRREFERIAVVMIRATVSLLVENVWPSHRFPVPP